MASETGDIVTPVLPAGAWDTSRKWDELSEPRLKR